MSTGLMPTYCTGRNFTNQLVTTTFAILPLNLVKFDHVNMLVVGSPSKYMLLIR